MGVGEGDGGRPFRKILLRPAHGRACIALDHVSSAHFHCFIFTSQFALVHWSLPSCFRLSHGDCPFPREHLHCWSNWLGDFGLQWLGFELVEPAHSWDWTSGDLHRFQKVLRMTQKSLRAQKRSYVQVVRREKNPPNQVPRHEHTTGAETVSSPTTPLVNMVRRGWSLRDQKFFSSSSLGSSPSVQSFESAEIDQSRESILQSYRRKLLQSCVASSESSCQIGAMTKVPDT